GAIDAAVRAVAALSSPSSPFVLTYFDRALVEHPKPFQRIVQAVVTGAGEPFTFGWLPDQFAPWMKARGFDVEWDRDAVTLAHILLPGPLAGRVDADGKYRRIALLRRSA